MNTLGEKIKYLRKQKDITQEKLAELINSTRPAVAKWETNAVYPPPEMIKGIADFFGVTTDYLLGRTITMEVQVHNNPNGYGGGDPRLLADKLNETGRRRDHIQKQLMQAGPPAEWMDRDILIDYLISEDFDRLDEEQCYALIRTHLKVVFVYPDREPEVKLKVSN